MASESPFRSVAIVAFGKLPILKPTSLLQDAQSNGFVAGLDDESKMGILHMVCLPCSF